MKTGALVGIMVAIFGMVGGGQWGLPQDAVWDGPQTKVEWIGFVKQKLQPTVRMAPEGTQELELPEWVGYFKRGNDWRVRIKSSVSGNIETCRRYSVTKDGWKVADIRVRGNRVSEVEIAREGIEVVLEMQ